MKTYESISRYHPRYRVPSLPRHECLSVMTRFTLRIVGCGPWGLLVLNLDHQCLALPRDETMHGWLPLIQVSVGVLFVGNTIVYRILYPNDEKTRDRGTNATSATFFGWELVFGSNGNFGHVNGRQCQDSIEKEHFWSWAYLWPVSTCLVARLLVSACA